MQFECLNQMMEFYSYKLIKSVFNYGKTAIYAGLWATRNVSKFNSNQLTKSFLLSFFSTKKKGESRFRFIRNSFQ